jgi:hypothetical protein
MTENSLEDTLFAADDRRMAAILKADPDELRACLSEDLVYVHGSGLVESRDQYIDLLVSGKRKYLTYDPVDRTARTYGDVTIFTGRLVVSIPGEAGPAFHKLTYTAVYSHKPTMRMVSWHACASKPT